MWFKAAVMSYSNAAVHAAISCSDNVVRTDSCSRSPIVTVMGWCNCFLIIWFITEVDALDISGSPGDKIMVLCSGYISFYTSLIAVSIMAICSQIFCTFKFDQRHKTFMLSFFMCLCTLPASCTFIVLFHPCPPCLASQTAEAELI